MDRRESGRVGFSIGGEMGEVYPVGGWVIERECRLHVIDVEIVCNWWEG